MADTERPSLLAAVSLAAQRGWDQQAVQLSASTGDSLTLLRHLADLLTVREAALAAARRAGDTAAEGRTLHNLGSAYQELRRSIGCHQDALAIRRETGDRHGEGRTLTSLGLAYQELRQPDRAAECWRDAAAALRDAGDREEAALGAAGRGRPVPAAPVEAERLTSWQRSVAP